MSHAVLTKAIHRQHHLHIAVAIELAIAVVLAVVAVRITTSLAMVPVAWSLVSVSAAMVFSAVRRHGHQVVGE